MGRLPILVINNPRKMSLVILALSPSTAFLAGMKATPKQQPSYPGALQPSEVGSTGLPGDIGFDPLGLASKQ